MKITQLLQVIKIVECGSINKAAKELYMSQSNLSTSIQNLEIETGIPIFQRTNSGVFLTEFGNVYYNEAKNIMSQFNSIEQLSSNFSHKVTLTLNVSVYYLLFVNYLFIDLLNEYKESKLNFSIREKSKFEVINDLKTGKSEIGVNTLSSANKKMWMDIMKKNNLEYYKLSLENPSLLIGPLHPLYNSDMKSVTPQDLKNTSLVLYDEPNDTFDNINSYILNLLEPKNIIHVSDRGSLTNILKHTSYFAIGAKNSNAYKNTKFYDGIKSIPIDTDVFKFEIGWIKNKNHVFTPIEEKFIQLLEKSVTG